MLQNWVIMSENCFPGLSNCGYFNINTHADDSTVDLGAPYLYSVQHRNGSVHILATSG